MLIIRFLPTEATALGKDGGYNVMALQIPLERRWKDICLVIYCYDISLS